MQYPLLDNSKNQVALASTVTFITAASRSARQSAPAWLQIGQQTPGRPAQLGVPNLLSGQSGQGHGQAGEQGMAPDVFQALDVEGLQPIPAFEDPQATLDVGPLLPLALPPSQELGCGEELLAQAAQVVVEGRPGLQPIQDEGQDGSRPIGRIGPHHPNGEAEQRFGGPQQRDGRQAVVHVGQGHHEDDRQQREVIEDQVDLVAGDVEELVPAGVGVLGIPGGQFGGIQDQGSARNDSLLDQPAHHQDEGHEERQQSKALLATPIVGRVDDPHLAQLWIERIAQGEGQVGDDRTASG
jgi:hypothetical protein